MSIVQSWATLQIAKLYGSVTCYIGQHIFGKENWDQGLKWRQDLKCIVAKKGMELNVKC